jgi:hypothetical protein
VLSSSVAMRVKADYLKAAANRSMNPRTFGMGTIAPFGEVEVDDALTDERDESACRNH